MSICWIKGIGMTECDTQVFVWLSVVIIFFVIIYILFGGEL